MKKSLPQIKPKKSNVFQPYLIFYKSFSLCLSWLSTDDVSQTLSDVQTNISTNVHFLKYVPIDSKSIY